MNTNDTIFVGFSGGRDSLAALLWVLSHPMEFGSKVCAVHFNHHLRGEAGDCDEAFCRAFCAGRNITCRVIDLYVTREKKTGESVEMAARRLRLEAYRTLAQGRNIRVVLGHHRQDRRENFFLKLSRGANASSLCSLRKVTQLKNLTILRPLLDFDREWIDRFLREQQITSWCEDLSNSDETIARNFVRHRLLGEFASLAPGAMQGLDHSMEFLACDASFLEETAQKAYEELSKFPDETPQDFWRSLHPAIRHRVFGRFLRERTGLEYNNRFHLSARFNRMLELSTGTLEVGTRTLLLRRNTVQLIESDAHTPEDACWAWDEEQDFRWGKYILIREYPDPKKIVLQADLFEAFFDADPLPRALTVSARRPGDKMTPFGSCYELKLKKLRIDRTLGAEEDFPVIRDESGIIFAPGIRHSAAYPVTERTRRIVRLALLDNREVESF